MPALPILKLPIIVLMKILRTIDFETVFPISLCSRKMYHLVKNFRDKTEPIFFQVNGKTSNIIVGTRKASFTVFVYLTAGKSKTVKSVNINDHLVPMHRLRKHYVWNTYWNDAILGIPAVYEYLSELFEYGDAPEVTVNRNTLWLLTYIEKRQGDNYQLAIEDFSEEVCHFILKNYHPTVVRTRSLPDNFPIAQYINSQSLSSLGKLSITLDDLLNMNCIDLFYLGKRFTGSEMKRLLQHWARGGSCRLKFFRLLVRDFNLEDVLGELTHTRMAEKREYQTTIFRSHFAPPTIFSDRLITRNDGVVASFSYCLYGGIVQFGVWPDSEGNEY